MEAEHDEGQAAHPHGVHESPWIMLLPLVLLAILSVTGGWVGVPAALGGNNHFEHFLDPVFVATGQPENALNARSGEPLRSRLDLPLVSVLTAAAGLLCRLSLLLRKPRHGSSAGEEVPEPRTRWWRTSFMWMRSTTRVLVTPLLMFSRVCARAGLRASGRGQRRGASSAAGSRWIWAS